MLCIATCVVSRSRTLFCPSLMELHGLVYFSRIFGSCPGKKSSLPDLTLTCGLEPTISEGSGHVPCDSNKPRASPRAPSAPGSLLTGSRRGARGFLLLQVLVHGCTRTCCGGGFSWVLSWVGIGARRGVRPRGSVLGGI